MYEFYAGCDTHKHSHFISIINTQGKVQESFEIINSLKGWQKAYEKSQQYPNILWGLENSSNFGKQFCKFLIKNNQHLKEINPVFTSNKRKKHTSKSKTDEIDSIAIAKITRDELNYLPDIDINEFQDELKGINRQRDRLIKDRTKYINRLHAKLTRINSSYEEVYGKLTNKTPLNNIEKAFSNSNMVENIVILQDVRLLKVLNEAIIDIEKILEQYLSKNLLLQNLDTFVGIDKVNASKMVGLIGDIKKFKNSDHLVSYAGIAPKEFSTGKSSKRYRDTGGNRELNTLFYMIALSQIRWDPEAKNYYKKKLQESKTKKQAIHCLMRRLIKVIYMMYKYNQPYKYSRTNTIELVKAA